MVFNKLEMVGLIKWMATKSEKDILDVRLDVSNNKLPGYNMELIYLANGIRKNTIPLDIPKQARSYSLEVIGSSDDLKKKIDYERIVSDGSTIVTNDLQLMAYLNSSIRRSSKASEQLYWTGTLNAWNYPRRRRESRAGPARTKCRRMGYQKKDRTGNRPRIFADACAECMGLPQENRRHQ
jgi:hypothetical protein